MFSVRMLVPKTPRAQSAWAGAIRHISKANEANGAYVKEAASAAGGLYPYSKCSELSRPTQAADQQLRPAVEEAIMSHFAGRKAAGSGYAEEGDFAMNGGTGRSDVAYDTHQIEGEVAVTVVDGKVRISMPRSSVPYKVSSKAAVSKEDVIAVQNAWADAIRHISKVYKEKGDYVGEAAKAAGELYAYGKSNVLFKPTKAAEYQFRPNADQAMSYFVGGNAVDNGYAEDGGFAINGGQGWADCVYDNHQIELKGDVAIAMGNYYFTCAATGEKSKVEYTFGYERCDDGKVRIFLHHSSVPFAAIRSLADGARESQLHR